MGDINKPIGNGVFRENFQITVLNFSKNYYCFTIISWPSTSNGSRILYPCIHTWYIGQLNLLLSVTNRSPPLNSPSHSFPFTFSLWSHPLHTGNRGHPTRTHWPSDLQTYTCASFPPLKMEELFIRLPKVNSLARLHFTCDPHPSP